MTLGKPSVWFLVRECGKRSCVMMTSPALHSRWVGAVSVNPRNGLISGS